MVRYMKLYIRNILMWVCLKIWGRYPPNGNLDVDNDD
jgi:hypothetical protein